MDKILIVSANEKSKDTLCELLKEYDDIQIVTTTSASKARRYASNNELSIAIINTPLREEFGTELSMDLSRLNIGTLLIVKSEVSEEISADVESFEEIKIVDRAKLVLIENENLSENEAHKYIEKEAMNRRLSRYQIAKEILVKYNIS